ncbi:MAG: hypothetical protein K2Z81_21370, partial [Cyanobacteria bacterium]|nr:hypothetical protein [Cyanobacteriota bacterium]
MRLSKKMILLLSMPLAFQLGVSYILLDQIQETERNFEQELTRMRIVTSLDEVQRLHIHSLAAAAFFSITKDEAYGEKHLEELNQLKNEMKHLGELTQHDPVLHAKTMEVRKAIAAVVPYELMMRKLSLLEDSPRVQESGTARELIKNSMQLIHDYQARLVEPAGDIESFNRSAQGLQLSLGLALLLIVAVTVLLLHWLRTYVLSAVSLLMQQVERFKKGELLKPTIKSDDELAELEGVVCESANSITRLEQLRQELCAVVSHDIRAPMTSIGGLITLLEIGALGQLSQKHQELNDR